MNYQRHIAFIAMYAAARHIKYAKYSDKRTDKMLSTKKNQTDSKEDEPYSSYDESDQVNQPPPPEYSTIAGKKLDFNYGSFPWRDISIQDANTRQQEYSVRTSQSIRSTPDVVLHARGHGTPIEGHARFGWSRSIKCGLGPNELSMESIEIKSAGALSKNWQFDYQGKMFSVLRDWGLASHYKIVDETTGEVVALYASGSAPGSRKGSLTIKEGVAKELQAIMVLAIVAVREKRRRRQRAGGVAGGAAAGGAGG